MLIGEALWDGKVAAGFPDVGYVDVDELGDEFNCFIAPTCST